MGATSVPVGTKVLLATFAAATPGVPLTVRRIRGSVMWANDTNTTTELVDGAIGAAVLEDTAIAVGIGSLPDPVTDVGDDIWMWWQSLHARVNVASAIGFVVDPHVYPVDSKGMRKVPDGKSIAVIVGNRGGGGAFVSFGLRVYSSFAR